MKLLNIFSISALLIGGVLFLTSCDDWTSVSPQTEIEDSRMFENEQGFMEVLNGVYLQLGNPQIYGRELTFGLVDVLGGMYSLSSQNGPLTYRQAFAGSYEDAGPRNIIDNIWSTSYNRIANLNKLIEELDNAAPGIFTQNNRQILKGEALGLRAFIHFDLLRLFSPSFAAGGADAPAIPYVTRYSREISPRLSGSAALGRVLDDLEEAESLLFDYDPIIPDVTDEVIPALEDRKLRFNYYAVKALQARAYLWGDEKDDALTAANEVIDVSATVFPWIAQSNVATSNEADRDRVFTTEHIFGLFVNDIPENYANLLEVNQFSNLIITNARINQQYEAVGASDYRQVYLIRQDSYMGTTNNVYGKLFQPENMPAEYANRMPLIRIPEMYYIVAECLADTDPQEAINLLNTVRTARGISAALDPNLNAGQIRDEIRKEYWKEFPSEGQKFFYLKRTHSESVPGFSGAYNRDFYVLPLPVREIEFGG